VKNIFKLLIISILFFTAATPLYSKGVYILCYHAFLDKKDPYSFTNDQFKDQLERLKNNGFKFVTFEDIIDDRISGNNNILISIDDGNRSVYQAYFAVMKPMGIKPLLGIYPAIINKKNYAMTWDQVKELSDDGCYIASHGYHHMFLSEKYYKTDPAGFKKEIYISKKILEEKLNKKIETMVYPFGTFSDIAVSELKNAGYKYGVTIVAKMENIPIKDNFQINRYLMTKPAQKDLIARISKQAQAVNVQVGSNENNAEKKDVPIETTPARVVKKSINYYPDRIKQIISEDHFVSNQKEEIKENIKKEIKKTNNNLKTTNTNTNSNSNFKPFVHKPETSTQLKKSKKETTEKKNRKKKRIM